MDRDTILFRTDPGSKLRGLLRSPAVCYQVDGIDPNDATGWSVLVKGRAVELHDPDAVRQAASLPLRYWTLGDKAHWIRIVPKEITGRRIWHRTNTTQPPTTGDDPGTGGTRSPADDMVRDVRRGPTPDES